MKQIGTQKFVSESGKAMLIVENDESLGSLHDFLMELKGKTVEIIQNAQKQEVEASEKIKDVEEKQKADKEAEVEKPKEEVEKIVPIEEVTVPIETK